MPGAGGSSVTVADSKNCTTTATVTIGQPAALLTASISSQVDVACFGQATGSATVTAAGGTPVYSYSWNTTPVQTGSTATGLSAGSYTVTVTDSKNCTTTATVTIGQPAALLTASISSQVDVACFGQATGSATVTAAGGTPVYSYSWNTTPVQTGSTATGLSAGSYTVTVTDSKNCTTTATVTIGQPAALLTASISSQVDVACFGQATGSATVTAAGGTPVYSYSWNTTPVQSGPTATGLSAGSYTVTVTDSKNCTTTATVTIGQPAALLTASISSQVDVACFGQATGSATVTAAGGTPVYSYSWNTTPVQTGSTATGLSAGSYTVTVTDSKNCTTTATVTIGQPAALLTASISSQVDVACFGQATGSATVTAAGGTPVYSYSWNTTPVQTGSTATGLSAGSYTVTVTDSKNCTTTATVTIGQPAALLTASISSQVDVACFGQATGSATVTAAGGTPVYSYSWNTTPVQSGPTATGLSAGSYTVTVTDSKNCTTTATVTIGQPAALLTASISSQVDVACFGQATGSATVTAAGGTPVYSYSWNTTPVQTGSTATGLSAGSYTVTVTDSKNCTTTATVTIGQPAALLTASISSQVDVACFGQATGSATVTAAGGTPVYSYSWNTTPVQSGPTATGLSAGSYTVTVTDSKNCTTTATVTIGQPAALLTPSISSQLDVACFGQATG